MKYLVLLLALTSLTAYPHDINGRWSGDCVVNLPGGDRVEVNEPRIRISLNNRRLKIKRKGKEADRYLRDDHCYSFIIFPEGVSLSSNCGVQAFQNFQVLGVNQLIHSGGDDTGLEWRCLYSKL